MKRIAIFSLLFFGYIASKGQFAPPAGQPGTTAIYVDSSAYVAWATGCHVVFGWQDIADHSYGRASAGDSSMAIGKADGSTVSLGDSGYAILTFAQPIKNGLGWDFAVFENSFDGLFLELGFVEVSSDGINYFRFPATSNTQDTSQTGSFADLDATKLDNLAGKYKVLYGTPFDLQQLTGIPELNVDSITHVKVVDVIGCIQPTYASHDQYGHIVNDPWPTAFPTGGFDLDAVGVINQVPMGIEETVMPVSECTLFPNPASSNCVVQYNLSNSSSVEILITDMTGRTVYQLTKEQVQGWQSVRLECSSFSNGVYFVKLSTKEGSTTHKIIVNH